MIIRGKTKDCVVVDANKSVKTVPTASLRTIGSYQTTVSVGTLIQSQLLAFFNSSPYNVSVITNIAIGFRATAGNTSASLTFDVVRATRFYDILLSSTLINLKSYYSPANSPESKSLIYINPTLGSSVLDEHPLARAVFTHPGSIKTLSNYNFFNQSGTSSQPGGAQGGVGDLQHPFIIPSLGGFVIRLDANTALGTDAFNTFIDIEWTEAPGDGIIGDVFTLLSPGGLPTTTLGGDIYYTAPYRSNILFRIDPSNDTFTYTTTNPFLLGAFVSGTVPGGSLGSIWCAYKAGNYQGGFFCCQGGSPANIYFSRDLTNWVTVATSVNAPNNALVYFYGEPEVYLTSTDKRSTDGITWTTGAGVVYALSAPAYGNSMFCLEYSGVIYYASDGITWVSTGISSATKVVFFNGVFYSAGNNTTNLFTSSDGISWTTTNIGINLGQLNLNPTLTIMVAANGYLSIDGITWKNAGININATQGDWVYYGCTVYAQYASPASTTLVGRSS